jgi:hypothetical protein
MNVSSTATETSHRDLTLQMYELLLNSRIMVQSIYAAAELDIAELLAEQPQSLAELALATKTKPERLERLLRYLISLGIFSKGNDNYYRLTPLAETLRSSLSASAHSWAIASGGLFWGPSGNLIKTLRTGETAFDSFYGMSIYDFLQKNPEAGEIFGKAMRGFTQAVTPLTLATYDFSQIQVLADIGGGQGQTLGPILLEYPEIKGILFDVAPVIENAETFLKSAGIEQRVQKVAGDFFKQIPTGADAYMIKYVLHNWSDNNVATILRNVRTVIPQEGRLLIMDPLIIDDNKAGHDKLLDMQMMIVTPGRERTLKELQSLIAKTGFELSRVYGEGLPYQILECFPVA